MGQKNNSLVGILLIPALAVAYYFGIALPNNQKARLNFEKHKYEDEQKAKREAKEKSEEEAKYNDMMLKACYADATVNYQKYIELNKTSSHIDREGSTIYTAPQRIWDTAARDRKESIVVCNATYTH